MKIEDKVTFAARNDQCRRIIKFAAVFTETVKTAKGRFLPPTYWLRKGLNMKKVGIYTLCFRVARFIIMRERPSRTSRYYPAYDTLRSLGAPSKLQKEPNPHPSVNTCTGVCGNQGEQDEIQHDKA